MVSRVLKVRLLRFGWFSAALAILPAASSFPRYFAVFSVRSSRHRRGSSAYRAGPWIGPPTGSTIAKALKEFAAAVPGESIKISSK